MENNSCKECKGTGYCNSIGTLDVICPHCEGKENKNMCCEMCDGYYGIKRIDNIYVCNTCDLLYPIKEEKSNE